MPRNKNIKILDFDGAKMGQGISDAIGAFKAIKKDGKTLAYFCDSNGAGAFTPMAASGAAAYIREGIKGKRSISGLGGLPALSETTIRRKGHDRFHYWTGAFAEHVSYQTGKVGKRSVGYVTMKPGTIKGGNVSYSKLARWLEHGTKDMPSRPLMQLALHDFVARKIPPMLRMTKKSIVHSIAYNHAEMKKGRGFDLGALAAINVANTFKKEDVFKQSPFYTEGKAEARKILNQIGLSSARLERWG